MSEGSVVDLPNVPLLRLDDGLQVPKFEVIALSFRITSELVLLEVFGELLAFLPVVLCFAVIDFAREAFIGLLVLGGQLSSREGDHDFLFLGSQ